MTETFLPEIMYKNDKILTFYTTFARKNTKILHFVCPKKNFFRGGGATHCPLSSPTHGWAPGLPPAKSGPADTTQLDSTCSVFNFSTKSAGSRRELVANSIQTDDADATQLWS